MASKRARKPNRNKLAQTNLSEAESAAFDRICESMGKSRAMRLRELILAECKKRGENPIDPEELERIELRQTYSDARRVAAYLRAIIEAEEEEG